jgi:hypothetical protein
MADPELFVITAFGCSRLPLMIATTNYKSVDNKG